MEAIMNVNEGVDVLEGLREAKALVTKALTSVESEIEETEKRLTTLRAARAELTGTIVPAVSQVRKRRPARVLSFKAAVKGAAIDKILDKLPRKFSIEEIRKIAKAQTGIRLAQAVRSGKVRKTATGYVQVAA